ncbi:MAG: MobA/MobL family protein [Vicinamibacterales bacterium]
MTKFLDRTIAPPGGGRAASGGSFYHVSFRSGSRSRGSCAASAHDYIAREGEYEGAERDLAIYTESNHLPAWADGDARAFWDAADLYERANGRLYITADYALPADFDEDEWIALARGFAQELTGEERLPYTLAIHAGRDEDGHAHNPHAHLIISERQNDGLGRTREGWFRRANSRDPAHGGAPKSRTFHGREWVERARERWADRLNEAFERKGSPERVDHRSYERQGIDRESGQHIGPSAAYRTNRGEPHDRLEQAATTRDDCDRLNAIERAIANLETERGGLAHQLERFEEYPVSRGGGGWGAPGRDDDSSRGR